MFPPSRASLCWVDSFCKDCEQTLPASAFYEGKKTYCKECWKVRVYARRDAVRAAGLCIECRTPVDPGPLCAGCQKVHRDRHTANKDKYNAKARVRRRQLRLDAFDAYGGAHCACCGESHVEFLTIDHIDGSGAEHRKELLKERGWNVDSRSMSGSHTYWWLKQNDYPEGFRVLCFNCNSSLGHYGYCPHTAVSPS